MLEVREDNLDNQIIYEKGRIKGSLFGFFVGDALGVPVEFVGREALRKNPVAKMLEYGTHKQPAGTWSDDSSMVIATMDSIINNRGINYGDMMDNFLKWYDQGEYTPGGVVFDIGISTSSALSRYKRDKSSFTCGANDEYSNGNGSLMRILPISLYLHYIEDPMFDVVKTISSMTHAHIYSVLSCIIYSVYIDNYLREMNVRQAYANMQIILRKVLENYDMLGNLDDLRQKFNRIIYCDISTLGEDDISSSGYVIDTLESCFWCLLNTNSYQEAVLKAVNLGGDADTIAAITGGLAGLAYGYDGIPEDWINTLKRKEYLDELVDKYETVVSSLAIDKVLYEWKTGLGNMNKRLTGENPLPNKDMKADATSWECAPFLKSRRLECHIALTPREFEIISMGHIPEVMEDHWFMYCDENSINYFRSWSGIQIFKGYYRREKDSYIIYALEINDNKDEYDEEKIDGDSISLFTSLIKAECQTY